MHVEFGRVEHEDNGVCFACLAISVIRCGMHCMGAQYCNSSAHFRFFDASIPLNVHSADSIGQNSLETMAMETKKRKASQRQCKRLLN